MGIQIPETEGGGVSAAKGARVAHSFRAIRVDSRQRPPTGSMWPWAFLAPLSRLERLEVRRSESVLVFEAQLSVLIGVGFDTGLFTVRAQFCAEVRTLLLLPRADSATVFRILLAGALGMFWASSGSGREVSRCADVCAISLLAAVFTLVEDRRCSSSAACWSSCRDLARSAGTP